MSRLNFRGWDGKRMHKIVRLGIGGFSHDVWTKDPVITTPMFFKSLKIMQSTGLLDKNGVEIFEGDIVEIIVDDLLITSAVFWDDGGWAIKANDWYMPWLGELYYKECEVIGNIYQHPELLK